MAGLGHLKRICKDEFSVAGAVQETSSSELLGGPGGDFLRGGAFWEHQIFRFAEMILRDTCSTSYDLASLFSWQAQYFRQVDWKKTQNALVRGRQLCTQLSISEGSLAELLCFWCCQIKNWRSLAELLRFGCCQAQKLRKSRRIASFWMLSTLKNEEVSQNCFVFDGVKCKHWGSPRRIASFSSFKIDR